MDKGTDDGSRMTGDRPVRFWEGLRLQCRGLLTFLQSSLCGFGSGNWLAM
jgi:hypothetical protein